MIDRWLLWCSAWGDVSEQRNSDISADRDYLTLLLWLEFSPRSPQRWPHLVHAAPGSRRLLKTHSSPTTPLPIPHDRRYISFSNSFFLFPTLLNCHLNIMYRKICDFSACCWFWVCVCAEASQTCTYQVPKHWKNRTSTWSNFCYKSVTFLLISFYIDVIMAFLETHKKYALKALLYMVFLKCPTALFI